MDPKGIEAGKAYVKVYLEDSGLHRGLGRASRRLRRFGANVAGFGRSLVGAAAVVAVPFVGAVRKFAEFDDAVRQVGAVTRATAADLDRLRAGARELGRTTSFTASEVAGLQTELGRAGFSPDEILAATPHVLNLARATGTELAEAAKYAGQTLRQFRMEAGEAGRVADVLAATANRSNNTLESIAQAMEYAGPVAADFNMSIEETAALVGVLGNVGVQGTNAGTALRRLLTLTGADAQRLEEIFGVAFADAAGDARPLVDVLGEVNDATADLGTAERSAKFKEAFGLLGITGASAIAGTAGDARELLAALQNAQGAAADTAEEMDAGLGGAWRRLMSAAEGLALDVGEALAPSLEELAGWITENAGRAAEWVKENRELIVTVAKWVAGIAAAGAALIGLGSGISAAGSAVGLLSTAVGLLLAHPVAAGFAAATVAIGYFATEVYAANSAVQDLNRSLAERNRLNGEIAGVIRAEQKEVLDGLRAEEDPAERARRAREELAFQRKELAGEEAALKGDRKRVDSYGGFARFVGNKQLELDERTLADREKSLADRKAYVAELEKIADRADGAEAVRAEAEGKAAASAERNAAAAAAGDVSGFGDLEEQARLARAGKNDDLKFAGGGGAFDVDPGRTARSAAAASALDVSSTAGQRLAATLLNGGGAAPAARTADAVEKMVDQLGEANEISERIEEQGDVVTFEFARGVA